MGLRSALAAGAVRGAHVLVVEVPGFWLERAAVERAALDRGWHLASAPADADVLAVCGRRGPELTDALERVWDQMPGPRARIEVGIGGDARPALDRAAAELRDSVRQQEDARERSTSFGGQGVPTEADDHARMSRRTNVSVERDAHMDMDDHMDMGMDMDMDMGPGMGGHMKMDMAPGGIRLAGGGDDRDGLEMDVLHLRYGPITRYWPAGLILRCTLHGDVIGKAEVELLATAADVHQGPDSPGLRSAWWCDQLTNLLALAGWADAAGRARRLRDSLLIEPDSSAVAGFARRIRRSRTLRWALRDLGVLTVEQLERFRLPPDRVGDAWDRAKRMLDYAETASPRSTATADTVAVVPGLVQGLELTTARLVVASLCLDPSTTVRDHP